MNKYSNIL